MNQRTNEQTKEKVKPFLKDFCDEYLTPSRIAGKNKYVCPYCDSGNKKNGTGAFSLDEKTDLTTFKCFSCGTSGDIITLAQHYYKTDYKDALLKLTDKYRINCDLSEQEEQTEPTEQEPKPTETIKKEQDRMNFDADYYKYHLDLDKTDYFFKRGITEKTQKDFYLGYCENWKQPTSNLTFNKAVIIPVNENSYLARDTEYETKKAKESKYTYPKNAKAGKTSLFAFNRAFNQEEKPIFITEGEIDALSFYEVGAYAVGLRGTGNYALFLEELEKLISYKQIKNKIVVCVDNDHAGQECTENLVNGKGTGKSAVKGLKTLNIAYCVYTVPKAYKDANEFLVNDREGFIKFVNQDFLTEKEKEELEQQEKAKQEYLKLATSNYIDDFLQGIEKSNTPAISTGYAELDKELEGGLYEGLYTLGAVSSLGKTTYILQMADQIASNGQDVLIFSLEMARNELIAKSISRFTAIEGLKAKNINLARTTRGITDYSRYSMYSKQIKDIIELAINDYKQIAPHIFIHEGNENTNTSFIRTKIEQHIKYTGNKPVVFIDYLQMIEPYNPKASDKQLIDHDIKELKRISRDFRTPIIAISSLNRDNYKTEMNEKAFKESGSIEYTTDVLLGLQFEGAGEKDFNLTDAKSKNPRYIEIVVLKNRNGQIGGKINYTYYPMFNYFLEE